MKTQLRLQQVIALFLTLALLVTMIPGSGLVVSARHVEVIVRGATLESAITAVQQYGGKVVENFDIINAVLAEVPQPALAALAGDRGVLGVFPNHKVEAAAPPGWGEIEFAESVGAAEVWAEGVWGQGVTVAFLDTGIEPNFVSLRVGPGGAGDRIKAYYDAIGNRVYTAPRLMQSPRDPNGHGTHVAGIVGNSTYQPLAGKFHGLAPAANLVAVRALNAQGQGVYADVLRGIQWIINNKDTYNIRVLNISMYAQPLAPYWADPFSLATMAAWNAGIVVVVSAGNGGPTPMSIGVPGNTPYVITVGAFTDNYTPSDFGDDYIPEFSAAGPTLDAFVKPDVIAPGAHIVSLMRPNTYLAQQYPDNRVPPFHFKTAGTSMSAAVVSGVAALMLSENPTLTPDEVKFRLALTARPQFSEFTGEAAYSIWQQGAGRIWAPDAVFTTIQGRANLGMDLAADLAGETHYQGMSYYDPETEQFHILGYETWAGGYETWAGGYETWAGGYETWAGGYETWAGGYETWAGGTTNWSGGFNDWVAAYQSWSDGWNAWAGGYETWAGGYETWAGGYETWAGGYETWAGGYETWAGGYETWAGGYETWAGGYATWAGGYETWAGGYETWAGGYETWAGGYETWAGAIGDPTWAAAFVNLQNVPGATTAVGFSLINTPD